MKTIKFHVSKILQNHFSTRNVLHFHHVRPYRGPFVWNVAPFFDRTGESVIQRFSRRKCSTLLVEFVRTLIVYSVLREYQEFLHVDGAHVGILIGCPILTDIS